VKFFDIDHEELIKEKSCTAWLSSSCLSAPSSIGVAFEDVLIWMLVF